MIKRLITKNQSLSRMALNIFVTIIYVTIDEKPLINLDSCSVPDLPRIQRIFSVYSNYFITNK